MSGNVDPGLLVDNAYARWSGLGVFSAYIGPSCGRDFSVGTQFAGDGTTLSSKYSDWRYGRDTPVPNTFGRYVASGLDLPTTIYITFPQQVEITSFSLRVYAQASQNADLGNTVGVRLILPDNASFTSASGVFLSRIGSAVPEPATWALLIAGFGLVGGVLRRSRLRRLRHGTAVTDSGPARLQGDGAQPVSAATSALTFFCRHCGTGATSQ